MFLGSGHPGSSQAESQAVGWLGQSHPRRFTLIQFSTHFTNQPREGLRGGWAARRLPSEVIEHWQENKKSATLTTTEATIFPRSGASLHDIFSAREALFLKNYERSPTFINLLKQTYCLLIFHSFLSCIYTNTLSLHFILFFVIHSKMKKKRDISDDFIQSGLGVQASWQKSIPLKSHQSTELILLLKLWASCYPPLCLRLFLLWKIQRPTPSGNEPPAQNATVCGQTCNKTYLSRYPEEFSSLTQNHSWHHMTLNTNIWSKRRSFSSSCRIQCPSLTFIELEEHQSLQETNLIPSA